MIARRQPVYENEYAKRLVRLDETLRVAVEANQECAHMLEQVQASGVVLDQYHWDELLPGTSTIWTRWDQWRAALAKCGWFEIR